MLNKFFKNESGVVSANWILLSVAMMSALMVAFMSVKNGTFDLASDIESTLTALDVDTEIGTSTESTTDGESRKDPVTEEKSDESISSVPLTEVTSSQFTSFNGQSDGAGGTIDTAQIDAVISSFNATSTDDLLSTYGYLATVDYETGNTGLEFEVATALLDERGIDEPWWDVDLGNLDPTTLSSTDFESILNASPPLATAAELDSLLAGYNKLHTLQLQDSLADHLSGSVDYQVIQALIAERSKSA